MLEKLRSQTQFFSFGLTDSFIRIALLIVKDIVDSGRRIKPKLHISATLDGVVSYNLPGIKEGFKLCGEIKMWNAEKIEMLHPELNLPDKEINVAHMLESSGTSFIFTGYLYDISEIWEEI